MKNYKELAIAIHSSKLTSEEVVLLIELLSNKIVINTISGMARLENKTPKGIRESKRYRKIRIGSALLCVKGVDDTKLPF
jgi:hypothetical protein